MGPNTAMKWCHLCLATILVTAGPAHAVKLYKWVDENGSTHYHQEPPPKGVQFVEEKDFDGETNVVPSPETEAEMHGPVAGEGGAPETAAEGGEAGADTTEDKPLTPEELTAIAEETGQDPSSVDTSGGANPAGGAESSPGAGTSGGAASSAGAAAAPGAAVAPVPPIAPPVVVPGP